MEETKKCSCGKPKETWANYCYNCFQQVQKQEEDKNIKLEYFLTIASKQLTNAKPEEVICYAQELEKSFKNWK